MNKNVELGMYKHYKGNVYEVIHIARHTESLNSLVIYTDSNKKCWARPIEMWFEMVNGVSRFTKI